MAPKKIKDPLLDLLDGKTAPKGDYQDILDLLGPPPGEPKPAAPQPDKPTYLEHLLDTKDSTDRAHVIMPTDLVDKYREYDRAPGGKDYRSEYKDVIEAVRQHGGIRQPLWISTDGKTAMLVEGNNRLAVAKELGIQELPVRITFDKKTMRNEGVDPVPLDPALKNWVRENRIEGRWGSDAFPSKGATVDLPKTPGQILYRGVPLDFTDKGMEQARAIMHPFLSDNKKDNTLERLYRDEVEGSFSDPALGPIMLDHMDAKHGGLGQHWTPDRQVANSWAKAGNGNVQTVVVGEYYGGGESSFNPGWKHEKEVPLDNHAEIRVRELQVKDTRNGSWNNVLAESVDRTIGSSKPDRIGFKPVPGPDSGGGLLSSAKPIQHKPSRHSRSYANPVQRENLKAHSPDLAYRAAVDQINHRVTEFVRAAYRSNPTFLTNHAEIDRITSLVAPAVVAGQLQVANITNAHLANLFHLDNVPPPDPKLLQRNGVDLTAELARPFWTAIKAARDGKPIDEALAAGEHRMDRMLATDFQRAKVVQSREALKASGIETYSRVAGPNACWLCSIAATQVYYTKDLLPIHPGCGCDVAPIPPGGQDSLDTRLNADLVLSKDASQVKLMTAMVESDATPAEYRDLIAVREHGETGPQLTWAHQKFTGPGDLAVPPSKEALAQQAYDAVRANGGVTIDLAGNQPTDGYAYAPYKTTEFRVSEAEFTPKHIDDYVDKHHAQLSKPGNNLGMWVKDGYVYLDVSQVGPPTVETFAKAQAAHQLAVFDLGNFNEIDLGTIDSKGYHNLGTPADLHRQYREQVARADQGRGAAGVPEVPVGAGGSARAARQPVEWTGPPVAKPYARIKGDIAFDWQMSNYDINKEYIRRGAQIAELKGYEGLSTEKVIPGYDGKLGKVVPNKLSTVELHRAKAEEINREIYFGKSDYVSKGAREALTTEGKELVAAAVHSKPTTEYMYRGLMVDQSMIEGIKPGVELSFPASGFTKDNFIAQGFAGDKQIPGWDNWQSKDVPKDARGVLFRLEPGAKLAELKAVDGAAPESVGFGKFEVLKVHPAEWHPEIEYGPWGYNPKTKKYDVPSGKGMWSPTAVTIRQTSMIEDFPDAHGGAERKGKSAKKIAEPIPEFSIVKKPVVSPEGYEEIGGARLYLQGVDPQAHQGLRDGLADFTSRHPEVHITTVSIENTMTDEIMAKACPGVPKDPSRYGWETRIELNPRYFGTGQYATLEESVKSSVKSGWSVPVPDDISPAHSVILHEGGHGLDAAGYEQTRKEVNEILIGEFHKLHPEFDMQRMYAEAQKSGITSWVNADGTRHHMTYQEFLDTSPEAKLTDEAAARAYRKFLQDNMSEYSFEDGARKAKFLRVKPGEALAEASADVDMNGDKASITSKALQRRMVENAKPDSSMSDIEYMKMRGGLSKPKGATPVQTPAEKVNEKEKARAEKQKQKEYLEAQRLAKKAEKEAQKREAAAARAAKAAETQRKRDERNMKTYGTTDLETIAKIKAEAAAMKAEKRKILDDEKAKGFGSVKKRIKDGTEIKAVMKDGKPDIAATFEKYSGGKWREELKSNWRKAINSLHPWALEAGKKWYPELHRLTVRLSDMYASAFQKNLGVELTPDLVSAFIGAFSENNKWANNLVGVRKFLDGTGKMPEHRNLIGLTVEELLAGPDARKFSLDAYDYDKRKVAGLQWDPKKGKVVKNTQMYRWLSDLPPSEAIVEAKPLEKQHKNEYIGQNYDFHVDKALRAAKNPKGGVEDLRGNATTAPKPADFAANAAGDYSRGTADRWVARIMLHTEDDKFAENLRNYAVTTNGVRDPVGYKLMSKILEEVAAEFPTLNVAAAQAGPWVEVVGPAGSIAYIDDLTSVESVNKETLRRVKEFGEVE